MKLSDIPRKGTVVRVEGNHGRIQPEGERVLVFFRSDRIRAVVLNQNGEPTFGAKSTRHGQQPILEGEEVIFLLGEDDRDRSRVHAYARYADWEHIRQVGQHQRAKSTSDQKEGASL